MDDAEFGIDDISEEEYKRLKEKTMAKKKKKELTKAQHMENNATVLNLVARLIVCGFLLN